MALQAGDGIMAANMAVANMAAANMSVANVAESGGWLIESGSKNTEVLRGQIIGKPKKQKKIPVDSESIRTEKHLKLRKRLTRRSKSVTKRLENKSPAILKLSQTDKRNLRHRGHSDSIRQMKLKSVINSTEPPLPVTEHQFISFLSENNRMPDPSQLSNQSLSNWRERPTSDIEPLEVN